MQSIYKKILNAAFLIFLLPHLLWAAPVASPSWYDISFVELTPPGYNLYNNSLDLWKREDLINGNVNFARIETGLKIVPPAGYENLSIRLNPTGDAFRFVKMSDPTDPTKWMPVSIRVQQEPLQTQTIYPGSDNDYSIVAGGNGTNLYLDVTTLPSNSGMAMRGDYYFPLKIQIMDKDGYILTEKTLLLFVHFRNKDTNVANPITVLTLNRYSIADNITVPYPYTTGSSVTKVGSIDFQSNENFGKYRLKISPADQPLFQFVHTNPNLGATIKYRVTIPDRTIMSYEQSFEFVLDYKGSAGNWNDFLEIGIRDVNYNNIRHIAGSYVSTIRIELISL